jgi:hypothetical protein
VIKDSLLCRIATLSKVMGGLGNFLIAIKNEENIRAERTRNISLIPMINVEREEITVPNKTPVEDINESLEKLSAHLAFSTLLIISKFIGVLYATLKKEIREYIVAKTIMLKAIYKRETSKLHIPKQNIIIFLKLYLSAIIPQKIEAGMLTTFPRVIT